MFGYFYFDGQKYNILKKNTNKLVFLKNKVYL